MFEYLRKLAIATALAAGALAAPAHAFTLSGTLRNSAAQPVAGADVKLYANNGSPIGLPLVQTNALGFYSIAGVPNGQYLVGFQPLVASHLQSLQVADRVRDANLTVDATAPAGYLVSGHVRNAAAAPLQGIDLNVFDAGANQLYTPGDNTDATGFYAMVLPPDFNQIKWRDITPALPGYLDVIREEFLTADVTIDITMIEGIIVTGTVRNAASAAIVGATVDFLDPVTSAKLTTLGNQTDGLGVYSVAIPKGLVKIHVKPPAGQLYVAQEHLLDLQANTTLDFTMQTGVSFSGTVTRTSSAVVAGVDIDVVDPVTKAKIFTPGDVTTAFGQYAVVVPPGTWEVQVEPPVATLLAALTQTMPINGPTIFSPVLQAGVLVSGNVKKFDNSALANVNIDAVNAMTLVNVPLVGDNTDAAGNFSVVLMPGTYKMQYKPVATLGLVAQETAPIAISTTTNLPPAILQAGIIVTGTVVDFVGTALPRTSIVVQVQNTSTFILTPQKTDLLGKYATVVPAGNYQFTFTPDPAEIVSPPVVLSNRAINFQQHLVNCRFGVNATTDTGNPTLGAVPAAVVLRQNTPNPFNPTTHIEFELAAAADARLEIFDARGRLVRMLLAGMQPAGVHRVIWNGLDERGAPAASGAYYYRLQTPRGASTRRMTLVR